MHIMFVLVTAYQRRLLTVRRWRLRLLENHLYTNHQDPVSDLPESNIKGFPTMESLIWCIKRPLYWLEVIHPVSFHILILLGKGMFCSGVIIFLKTLPALHPFILCKILLAYIATLNCRLLQNKNIVHPLASSIIFCILFFLRMVAQEKL